MLPEALVIFACVNNTGCTESTGIYFSQHPEVKKTIEDKAENARQIIGPRIIDSVGPFIYVVAGGTGTIHIDKYFSLQIRKDSSILSYHLDF